MRVVSIKKTNRNFDREIFNDIEKQIELKLPLEYIEFLEKYNGGRPENNIVELKGGEIKSFSISIFFGVNLDNNSDFLYHCNLLGKRIPKKCVPIAYVEGGNIVCVNLSADKYGYIYLWDHDVELLYGDDITVDNMYFIAKSFAEFMKMIKPYNPTNEELSEYKVLDVWVNPEFMKKIKKRQN